MSRRLVAALVLLPLCAGPSALAAQAQPQINPLCERYVPAALVGRTVGQPKAALIPRQPRIGAGGDCNYVDDPSAAKPHMMLLADLNEVASHDDFEHYVNQTTMHAISGVGDEAMGTASIVVARKGKLLVVLSAFPSVDLKTLAMKPYFTQAQLIDLVRQALAKGS